MFYKALNGVKVLEFGNLISAPFCAKILGDLGAEVIKIEEPEIRRYIQKTGTVSQRYSGHGAKRLISICKYE
jgi:crotonobetainyl-CoA:carnitine CoA-transferase CaiB-like acyl-CoA transferase